MLKTLVTGGTGYLGRHLIESLLADEIPLRVLVYSEWKREELEALGVEVIEGDVRDPETLIGIADGVDTVYHLVGGGSSGIPDPFDLNTQGTRNLMQVCHEADIRAFVYVSSSSVYGRQPDPVNEDTPPAPRFEYPQSKLDAELLLVEAAQAIGFPAAIARMGGIYGPGAAMVATEAVQRGQMRVTGDGQNTISVIHVDDAVRALRAMADAVREGQKGRVYCLGDNEPVQLLTFHNHFAQLLHAPPVRTTSIRRTRIIIAIARFLSRMVGRQSPLSEALIEMSTLNVRMQNGRMRSELGIDPLYPTYREGLAQVAWVLQEEEE